MKNNKGLSLTELLIALSLSGLLMLGLISLLLLGRKNFATLRGQQQLFNQARQVELIFREAILHAGYIGCKTLDQLALQNNAAIDAASIKGYNAIGEKNWQPKLPLGFDKKIKANSDVLVLRFMRPENSLLRAPMKTNNSPIKLVRNIQAPQGSLAVISDCRQANVFRIEKEANNNFSHPTFALLYSTNARFGLLQNQRYFIKASSRKYQNKTIIYALYRQDNKKRSTELVPGIEALHFEFAAHNKFLSANKIRNWMSVDKVKIDFTSQTYILGKLYRKSFQLILALRNRT